jgi:peptidoglycan/xylan/chitin deacetylase (PgdA/CDA1 family)
MRSHPTRAPFSERGGSLRGLLDLATGRYPGFLFGTGVGAQLPVFHVHEASPASLLPRLQYLAENGYRTVTSDAIAALVRRGVHPGPRSVALCFDDAWASLWTVAAPLLRRFGFSAITYAIPGRIADADAVRPTIADGMDTRGDEDRSSLPFVTWPELRALAGSGVIDVQSHTWSHSAVFTADQIVGFVSPLSLEGSLLDRPRLHDDGLRFVTGDDLGAPLFPTRSRMADGHRYLESVGARQRCVEHVAHRGGVAFFDRPGWRNELSALARDSAGRFESDDEREAAVTEELERGRSELDARLGINVRHVCLPWGVGGNVARRAAMRLGFDTMCRDRLFGRRVVTHGDDAFSLMRLHDRFIFCLPGRGRRWFFSVA